MTGEKTHIELYEENARLKKEIGILLEKCARLRASIAKLGNKLNDHHAEIRVLLGQIEENI